MPVKPLYKEITYVTPEVLFAHFSGDDGAVFLDSAKQSDQGRYSYIAIDPFLILTSKDEHVVLGKVLQTESPFDVLQKTLKTFQLDTISDCPPFQGGASGLLSYDLYQHLENIPKHDMDDMQFPDMAVGFYDLVIAFDHKREKAWIFSSGFPERVEEKRKARAQARLRWLENTLVMTAVDFDFLKIKSLPSPNFARDSYVRTVRRVIDYIYEGDIFEACLTQRFKAELAESVNLYSLYMMLRHINAAPFACFMRFGDTALASASPERFLELTEGCVETRPIKGTARRDPDPLTDAKLAAALEVSEKDRSENIMIVDLMRNDLSRVCKLYSVVVEKLCGLETFETVHHLVSVVKGELQEGVDAVDLLKATFPGGSITGAPKIRAMEIIAECEPHVRGPYCGSAVFIGFNGNLDSSILIRTFAIKDGYLIFNGGGAVTADSDPAAEYDESIVKIKALARCLREEEIVTS